MFSRKLKRDLLCARELLAFHGLPGRGRGELCERAERIVHLGRDPHALILGGLGSDGCFGEPCRADLGDVSVVGAAASAHDVDPRESVSQCGVRLSEVDRVALVELRRLVEFGVAFR